MLIAGGLHALNLATAVKNLHRFTSIDLMESVLSSNQGPMLCCCLLVVGITGVTHRPLSQLLIVFMAYLSLFIDILLICDVTLWSKQIPVLSGYSVCRNWIFLTCLVLWKLLEKPEWLFDVDLLWWVCSHDPCLLKLSWNTSQHQISLICLLTCVCFCSFSAWNKVGITKCFCFPNSSLEPHACSFPLLHTVQHDWLIFQPL